MFFVTFIPSHFLSPTSPFSTPQRTQCRSLCNSRFSLLARQRTKIVTRIRTHLRVVELQLSSGSGNAGSKPPDERFHDRHDDDEWPFHQRTSPFTAYALYLLAMRSTLSARSRTKSSLPPSFRTIRVSHLILALNVAIFLYQTAFAPTLLMAGAKVNSAILSGQYYRLISSMFIHASTTHLLINSFSLHSTGPSVESWFGKKRFFLLYIVAGLCGNFLSLRCTPTPAVGASGAIFGLVGASAVLLARHRDILGPRSRRALQSLVYIVIMNFGLGLTPGSRIDNFGHLGGFLGGIAYSYLFGPRLMVKRRPDGRLMVYDVPIFDVAVREVHMRLLQLRRLAHPQ